jgi:hypothetical protein
MPDIGKGRKKSPREVIHYNVDCGHINDHLPMEPDVSQLSPAVKAAPGSRYSVVGTGTDSRAAGRQGDSRAGQMHIPTRGSVSQTGANGTDFNRERLSEPISEGHAAYSTADHGVGAGRNPGLAYDHPNLRQSSTDIKPFANVTANGNQYVGQVAFGGMEGPTQVSVARLDMWNGTQHGLREPVSPHPGSAQAAGHPSRNSATRPNGSHSTANPVSTPRPAMKGSEALDIMKRTMRAVG